MRHSRTSTASSSMFTKRDVNDNCSMWLISIVQSQLTRFETVCRNSGYWSPYLQYAMKRSAAAESYGYTQSIE